MVLKYANWLHSHLFWLVCKFIYVCTRVCAYIYIYIYIYITGTLQWHHVSLYLYLMTSISYQIFWQEIFRWPNFDKASCHPLLGQAAEQMEHLPRENITYYTMSLHTIISGNIKSWHFLTHGVTILYHMSILKIDVTTYSSNRS